MSRLVACSSFFRPLKDARLPPTASRKLTPTHHDLPIPRSPRENAFSRRDRHVRKYSTRRQASSPSRFTPPPQHESNPLVRALLFVGTIGLVSFAGLKVYDKLFQKAAVFPKTVEDHLRKAIWLSEIDKKPDEALQEFYLAIRKADELGMDPLSSEYIGMFIRLSQMQEQAGRLGEGFGTIATVWKSLRRYVVLDMANLGILPNPGYDLKGIGRPHLPEYILNLDASGLEAESKESAHFFSSFRSDVDRYLASGRKPSFSDDTDEAKRRQPLYTMYVSVCHAMGARITAFGHPEEAAAFFDMALHFNDLVTRKLELFPNEEESLIDYRQLATVHSSLADALFQSGGSYIAAFKNWQAALNIFRARNGSQPTCEEVTLLNNMANVRAMISQQYGEDLTRLQGKASKIELLSHPTSDPSTHGVSPYFYIPARPTPLSDEALRVERDEAMTAAKRILETAHKVASNIKPPIRSFECDFGCIVAAANLALFLETAKDLRAARQKVIEARSLIQGQLALMQENPSKELALNFAALQQGQQKLMGRKFEARELERIEKKQQALVSAVESNRGFDAVVTKAFHDHLGRMVLGPYDEWIDQLDKKIKGS